VALPKAQLNVKKSCFLREDGELEFLAKASQIAFVGIACARLIKSKSDIRPALEHDIVIMKKSYFYLLLISLIISPLSTASADATWTVMVYMAADNNLEQCAINDYVEMINASSTDSVKIVVQLDRYDGDTIPFYDGWTDTRRFVIGVGSGPYMGAAVQVLEEQNMADPDVLKSFMTWAASSYTASNYALILWNHGGGWRSRASRSGPQYDVCWDDTNGGFLYNHDVRDAIVASGIGGKLKLIGFDACQMQMLETVYELRGLADVVVGSEENEPGPGWPYTEILSYIVSYPTSTAQDWSKAIVDSYEKYYSNNPCYFNGSHAPDDITLSSYDMAKLNDLTNAIDALADRIISGPGIWYEGDVRWSAFSDALNTDAYYGGDGVYHLDLYKFVYELKSGLDSDDTTVSKCQAVMDALDDGVIASWAGTNRDTSTIYGSYGLAIYCPSKDVQMNPAYDEKSQFYPTGNPVSFVQDHKWDDLLRWYYAPDEEILPTGIEVSSIKSNVFHRGSGEKVTVTFAVGESGKVDGYVFNVAADKVYTIPSRAVSAGDGCEIEWSGYNDANKLVAPGIYIFSIRLNDKYSTNPKVIVLP